MVARARDRELRRGWKGAAERTGSTVCTASKHSLDNGVLSCDDPKRLQAICDGLSAEKIDALLRKWLRLLPHPYTTADREAGYRYQVSILQTEFSLTQVFASFIS